MQFIGGSNRLELDDSRLIREYTGHNSLDIMRANVPSATLALNGQRCGHSVAM
jgi:hypothetical protein